MIPSHAINYWKYYDFISIVAIFIMLSVLLTVHYRKNGSLQATISQTVAHSKHSSLTFSIFTSIFFPLYYVFMYFWVAPLKGMPIFFYYLLMVSAICELIFVWVPAINGIKKNIHEVTASFVGMAMLVVPILFLIYGNNLSSLADISIIIFYTLTLIIIISLISKRARKYTIFYESIYCVIFVTVISIIAHS
jgi:hypothetical protein